VVGTKLEKGGRKDEEGNMEGKEEDAKNEGKDQRTNNEGKK
jgi:hypothetical protein